MIQNIQLFNEVTFVGITRSPETVIVFVYVLLLLTVTIGIKI